MRFGVAVTKTDADIREGQGESGEREGDGAWRSKSDGDDVGYSRWHSDEDGRTRARGYERGMADSAVAYTRRYVPRTATRVSRKGIRPISINGQGDTYRLIVTDGYGQLIRSVIV